VTRAHWEARNLEILGGPRAPQRFPSAAPAVYEGLPLIQPASKGLTRQRKDPIQGSHRGVGGRRDWWPQRWLISSVAIHVAGATSNHASDFTSLWHQWTSAPGEARLRAALRQRSGRRSRLICSYTYAFDSGLAGP